jgi:hypothetical protein
MRQFFALLLCLIPAAAQTCVPGRILPSGSVAGVLGDASCRLAGSVPYASYLLVLPARGALQIDVAASPSVAATLRDSNGVKLETGTAIHRPIEAGTYTILVSGSAGPFTLRTSFSAEPGMWCSQFESLGLNQTAAGRFGAAGCTLPDGTPYDSYPVHAFGAGSLTVTVVAQSFIPSVTIRDSDGAAIASGDAGATAALEADNDYQIVVLATAGQPGDYQISTQFAPDPAETCRALRAYSDPGEDAAVLGSDSCSTLAPSGDITVFNYYVVTVAQPGQAAFDVSSNDFDPVLRVLNQAGEPIVQDAGGGPVAFSSSALRLYLTPGTYLVQVASSVASGGSYRFAWQLTPGAPLPCTPTPYNAGDASTGTLTADSCRTASGVSDVYTLKLDAAGTLEATVAAAGFSSTLTLLDARENRIVQDSDTEGLGSSSISADLPAGDYLLVVASAIGSGTYQLSSKFTAHDLTPCGYVQPVDPNTGFVQKLGSGSCRGANGQPEDWYEFTIQSDSTVAAVMTSSEVDGYLRVTDTSGATLRGDDNSYGFGDPMIVQFLSSGTYRLAARAAGGSGGGLYRVDVLATAGPHPPFCAARSGLTLGASVSGSIGYTGCLYPDKTFADVYQLKLDNPASLDLRLNSGEFDATLILLDGAGNVLAIDENGGDGTNARVLRDLPAGTYFVVAKPFSDLTLSGAYTLSAMPVQ